MKIQTKIEIHNIFRKKVRKLIKKAKQNQEIKKRKDAAKITWEDLNKKFRTMKSQNESDIVFTDSQNMTKKISQNMIMKINQNKTMCLFELSRIKKNQSDKKNKKNLSDEENRENLSDEENV